MDRVVRARVLLAEAAALGVTIEDLIAESSPGALGTPGTGPTVAEYVDTVTASFSKGASPQRQRAVGIVGAGCARPTRGCCLIIPSPSRTAAKTGSDPNGLRAQEASGSPNTLTMRVHDSGSKMDNPLSGSCWRGRWPRSNPVPEILSAALRWAK